MKKLILTGLLVGAVTSAFSQGQVTLRNILNTDTSPTATANGLFFLDPDAPGTGQPAQLIASDFNAVFYGGANASSLNLLASFIGAGANGVNAAGPGTFFSSTIASIPGVPSGTATLKVEAWLGNFPSYQAAFDAGAAVGTLTWVNPLGNPAASPPDVPPDLTGMGAVVLTAVPEPSTFALAGLGAAALLIFRRRK
jgi:hypothetical protein